jgi:hypothetical protein
MIKPALRVLFYRFTLLLQWIEHVLRPIHTFLSEDLPPLALTASTTTAAADGKAQLPGRKQRTPSPHATVLTTNGSSSVEDSAACNSARSSSLSRSYYTIPSVEQATLLSTSVGTVNGKAIQKQVRCVVIEPVTLVVLMRLGCCILPHM